MNKDRSHSNLIERRADLLAELFLQDLDPEFLARPTEEFRYDFLAGFRNSRGGVNMIAVEVYTTEINHDLMKYYYCNKFEYERLFNSNIPVLLLVVNPKENEYSFAWPNDDTSKHQEGHLILIHLIKVDDRTRGELRARLAA